MIRTLWFYVVLFVSTMWHGALTIGGALLGVRRRSYYDRMGRGWGRWILTAAGTPVEVEGMARIPAGRPVVYASNHSSMFDIWALYAKLPGSVRFVAKQELERIPFFGRAMTAAGNVVIDRAHPKQAQLAYSRAAAAIQSGLSCIVFPEGTRSTTGEFLPFKTMPFGLAIVAGVPLVPLYVHNTFEILPKKAWRLRRRPIRVRVGTPIDTAGMTLDDRRALRDRALEAVRELRARVDVAPVSG